MAFAIASQMTWADAMGLVVIEGIVILVLVLTGFRTAVFHAIPAQLKVAISVGIGLFIALIGFVDAGFVHRIPDIAGTTVPVQLGAAGQLSGWPVLVFVFGLLLVIALWVLKVRGAILISIIVTTRRGARRRGRRRPGQSGRGRRWLVPHRAASCLTTGWSHRTSARSASSR